MILSYCHLTKSPFEKGTCPELVSGVGGLMMIIRCLQ